MGFGTFHGVFAGKLRGVPDEAMQVFIDARQDADENTRYAKRSLNWLASSPVSVEEFIIITENAIPDGYNAFAGPYVGRWLRKYNQGDQLRLWMGRAMSPLLLVTGPLGTLKAMKATAKRAVKADEVDLHLTGYDVENYDPIANRARRPGSMDPYPVFKHFNEPVLRLWWD